MAIHHPREESVAQRGFTLAALATIVVAFAAFAASAAARPAPEGVVVEGLSDPRGIDAITNRAMLVAESGSGSITLVQ
jgi:hypothetical protein